MIDNHFDNFVHGKLNDHEAPVPAGLWDKVADGQFDQFISGKLKDREAPVPADLWEKITDTQFDSFIAGKLADHVAPVPAGLWEKIHPEETDDRKGFAWFRNPAAGMMVAALLLLVATLGGYFYFTSDSAVDNRSDSGSIHKNPAPQPTDGTQVPGIPGNGSAAVTPATTDGPQAAGSAPGITELEKHDAEVAAAGLKKPATPATHAAGRAGVTPPPADPRNSSTMNALSGRPVGTPTNSMPADKSAQGFPFYKDPVTGNNGSLKNNGNPATTNNNSLTNGNIPQTNDFAFIEPYHTASFTAVTIPSDANRDNRLLNLSDKQLTAGNHTGQFRNVVICPTDRKGLNTDLHLEVYASPDLAFRSLSNISASQQYLAR
ncbi:MAG: PorT family protein, partial [Sediminibacterium sp.]|nr:PorT family protein [Sediminibacterium sp.]